MKDKETLKNYFYLILIFVMVVAIASILISYKKEKSENDTSTLAWASQEANKADEKLFDPNRDGIVKVSISTEVIQDELRNADKLITQEYLISMVEKYAKTTEG